MELEVTATGDCCAGASSFGTLLILAKTMEALVNRHARLERQDMSQQLNNI
jgi:hypothetical protein